MNVDIREATSEDVDRLCTLTRQSIKAVDEARYAPVQISVWADAVGPDLYPIDAADAHVLVAESDREVAAVGWMTSDAGDYFAGPADGELTGMYVHPSVAREGVGTRLYERLEAAARGAGVESLGLWASLNAVAFYRTLGYTRVIEQTVEYEDVEVPVLEMRKVLG